MVDHAALKKELEGDPKYTKHIQQGNDATIAEMYNAGRESEDHVHHSDVSKALARFRVSHPHETASPHTKAD